MGPICRVYLLLVVWRNHSEVDEEMTRQPPTTPRGGRRHKEDKTAMVGSCQNMPAVRPFPVVSVVLVSWKKLHLFFFSFPLFCPADGRKRPTRLLKRQPFRSKEEDSSQNPILMDCLEAILSAKSQNPFVNKAIYCDTCNENEENVGDGNT